MGTRVLYIGLDSAGASLIERWAKAGELPHFRRLLEESSAFRLKNSLATLPGAIWTELPTGRWGHQDGWFFHPLQFYPDVAILRPVAETDMCPDDYVWNIAARAGLRCAAIDVPFMSLSDESEAVQIREWAVHDCLYGPASRPPELIDTLLERFGRLPLSGFCDAAMPEMGREAMADALGRRAEPKIVQVEEMLRKKEWDLFYVVFGETHCAGHHLWPSPAADPPDFGPMLTVYKKADEMLGRVRGCTGPDTKLVVTASHGIGPYLAGPQILPEVVARLGLTGKPDSPFRRGVRGLRRRFRSAPRPFRTLRVGLEKLAVVKALGASVGAPGRSIRNNVKAIVLPNNRCGAIRLNLKGRERNGAVEPADADALLDWITAELKALTDGKNGPPIVKRVDRADDLFGPARSPLVPDLIVVFVTNIGPIEQAYTPSLGLIHQPIRRPECTRYADHTPDNRTWIVANDYPGGNRVNQGCVVDVAPTLLTFLGLPIPERMAGRSLPRLRGEQTRFANAPDRSFAN